MLKIKKCSNSKNRGKGGGGKGVHLKNAGKKGKGNTAKHLRYTTTEKEDFFGSLISFLDDKYEAQSLWTESSPG